MAKNSYTEKRKSAAAGAKVVRQSRIGTLSGWGLGRRDLRAERLRQ